MTPGLRCVLLAAAVQHAGRQQLAEAPASEAPATPASDDADQLSQQSTANAAVALLQMRKGQVEHGGELQAGLEHHGKELHKVTSCKVDCRQDRELNKLFKLNKQAYENFTSWEEHDKKPFMDRIEQQDLNITQARENLRKDHEKQLDQWQYLLRSFKKRWKDGKLKQQSAFDQQNAMTEDTYTLNAKVLAYQKKKFDKEKERLVKAKESVSNSLTAAKTLSDLKIKTAAKGLDKNNKEAQKTLSNNRRAVVKNIKTSPIANGIKKLNKELLMWLADEETRKEENDAKARATAGDIMTAQNGYREMLSNYAKNMRGIRDRARAYKNKNSDLLSKFSAAQKKQFNDGAKKVQKDLEKVGMEQEADLSAIDSENQRAIAALDAWTKEWKVSAESAASQSEREFFQWLDENGIDLETLQMLLESSVSSMNDGMDQNKNQHEAVKEELEKGYKNTLDQQKADVGALDDSLTQMYKDMRQDVISQTNDITSKVTEEVAETQPLTQQVLKAVETGTKGMESKIKDFELKGNNYAGELDLLNQQLKASEDFFGKAVPGFVQGDNKAFEDLQKMIGIKRQTAGDAVLGANASVTAAVAAAQKKLDDQRQRLELEAEQAQTSLYDLFGNGEAAFQNHVDSNAAKAKADVNAASELIQGTAAQDKETVADIYRDMMDNADGKAPLLNSKTKSLDSEMRQAKNGIDALIQGEKSSAGARLLEGVSAEEQRITAERQRFNADEEKEVRSFLESATKDLDGKTGELTAIEQAMQRGMAELNGDAKAADSTQNRLKNAQKVLNMQIEQEFSAISELLSNNTMEAVKNEQDLLALVESRNASLLSLEKSRISTLEREDRQRFTDAKLKRDETIQNIMNDHTLSFEEKQIKIQAAEKLMHDVLGEIMEEAKVSESELQEIQVGIIQEGKKVASSAKAAHDQISADQLMQAHAAGDLDKQLEARSKLLLSNVKNAMTTTDKVLEEKLDAVAKDAEDRIKSVLADQNLSDEEKVKKIEMIDKFTREAVKDLAQNQVAEDQNLTTFASAEMSEEAAAEMEMQKLQNSMEKAQVAWAQENVKDKQDMHAQTTKVQDLTESLLTMLDQKAGMSESELADLNAKQQMALKETQLQAEHQAGDKESAAKAAAELAEMVAARTKDMGDMTAQELAELEQRLDLMAGYSIDAVSELQKELDDEKSARDDSMEGGKTYLMQRAGTVVDQLNAVAHILESASTTSLTKQRKVVHKLDEVKALVHRLIQETEEVLSTGMGNARARAQNIQNMVNSAQSWEDEYGPRIKENEKEFILTMRGVGAEANAGQDALVKTRGHEASTLGRQAMSAADDLSHAGSTDSAAAQAKAAMDSALAWEAAQKKSAEERIGLYTHQIDELGAALGPKAEHILNNTQSTGDALYAFEEKIGDQTFNIGNLERDLQRAMNSAASDLELAKQERKRKVDLGSEEDQVPTSFAQTVKGWVGDLASRASSLLEGVQADEYASGRLELDQDKLDDELSVLEAVDRN